MIGILIFGSFVPALAVVTALKDYKPKKVKEV
jgi:hypothetical protein